MCAVLVEPYHLELIDGREVEKPSPKKLHAIVQAYLQFVLLSRVRHHYLCAAELSFWCGPDRLVPDLTVVRWGAEYRDNDLVEAPTLVVEILSPGQTIGNLMDKASRLVNAGTQYCWVIWPERRRAWTYTVTDGPTQTETLTASFAAVPDTIVVPVNDLWAELDRGREPDLQTSE